MKLIYHCCQVFHISREGCQVFDIVREGFKFGIGGSNIRSECIDFILGLVVGGVKVLVAGVGHLGYKQARMGLVGSHRTGFSEVYHGD